MRVIMTAAIMAASLAASAEAMAFTLLGGTKPTKGWRNPEVEFHVNPANCPDNVNELLEKAFDVWNGVATSNLTVTRGSDSQATIDQVLAGTFDVTPSVHCLTNMAALGLDPNSIPGVATGQSYDADGYLLTGLLILNVQEGAAANINNFDSNLTVDVITHEIGHVLGLGHSADPNALMYYDASLRKAPYLAQDDLDGVTYLYARNEIGGDPAFGGCAVIGTGGGKSSAVLLLLTLMIPMLSALRRRRK